MRGGVKKKFRLWYACGQCEQYYHGVVQCALGWACWKTYVDRPEGDQIRDAAMGVLGQGLSAAHHHEDALSVGKARLSMLRRLRGSVGSQLGAQGLIAKTYARLDGLKRPRAYSKRYTPDVWSSTARNMKRPSRQPAATRGPLRI